MPQLDEVTILSSTSNPTTGVYGTRAALVANASVPVALTTIHAKFTDGTPAVRPGAISTMFELRIRV